MNTIKHFDHRSIQHRLTKDQKARERDAWTASLSRAAGLIVALVGSVLLGGQPLRARHTHERTDGGRHE